MKGERAATVAAKTISAILVDDEPLAREELSFLLKAHPEVHIVAQGKNGLEAFNPDQRTPAGSVISGC